jgi:hypothetical protein
MANAEKQIPPLRYGMTNKEQATAKGNAGILPLRRLRVRMTSRGEDIIRAFRAKLRMTRHS